MWGFSAFAYRWERKVLRGVLSIKRDLGFLKKFNRGLVGIV